MGTRSVHSAGAATARRYRRLLWGGLALGALASCGGDGAGDIGDSYTSVVVADFNGDGWPDVAASAFGGSVTAPGHVAVFLQEAGMNRFLPPTLHAVGNNPASIAAGDIDGDGRVDLVTANSILATSGEGSSDVSVLLQTGPAAGSFGMATAYPAPYSPHGVAIGDLNGDGRPDLAVASYDGVSVLMQSAARPGSFLPYQVIGNVTAATSITIADLNGDGRPDLAGSFYQGVFIAMQDPSLPGAFPALGFLAAGQSPNHVAAADIDGDGRVDLAVANHGAFNVAGSASASVILQGVAGFMAPVNYPTQYWTQNVAIADLDGDGRPDVAAANFGTLNSCQALDCDLIGTGISLLMQRATAPGSLEAAVNLPSANAMSVTWLATADIDRDGLTDLVVAQNGGLYIRYQDPQHPGTFGAPMRIDR